MGMKQVLFQELYIHYNPVYQTLAGTVLTINKLEESKHPF